MVLKALIWGNYFFGMMWSHEGLILDSFQFGKMCNFEITDFAYILHGREWSSLKD